MKRLLAILALGSGLGLANAQEIKDRQDVKEKDLPPAVQESFKKDYPDANAKWEKEGNTYEAEFRSVLGINDNSITYDASGKVVESKIEIRKKELPEKAQTYISANIKGMVDEVWKVRDEKGDITYKVKVKDEKYIFSPDGTFLEKKAMEKGKKDMDMKRDKKDKDRDEYREMDKDK